MRRLRTALPPAALVALASILVSAPNSARAQAAGDYRSAATGDWSTAATWQTFDGTTWVAAATAPSSASGAITVRSPHVVTVSTPVTADQVTVDFSGTLEVSAAGTLTVADGTGIDLEVFGLLGNAGTISRSTGATIAFDLGGRYAHRFSTTPGAIPIAAWDPTSRCEIVGYTTNATSPTNLGQVFGTLEWNCPAQTSAINFGGGLATVNGDFVITSTGTTGSVRLAGNGNFTTTVAGKLRQDGGTLVLTSLVGNIVLQVNGDVQQNAGILDLQLSGAGGQAELRVKGNATFNGTVRRSGSSTPLLVMNGTGSTQSFSSASPLGSGVWFQAASGANVALATDLVAAAFTTTTISGTLDAGTHAVRGHTFTITSGGTLKVGTGGLAQVGSGTLNVQTGGTLQARGNAVTMQPGISSAVNVAGSLQLQGGSLSMSGGSNPATVSNGGTLDLGGGTLALGSGTLTVFAGGRLRCGTGTVTNTGAGAFVLSPGGELAIGAPDGIAAAGAAGNVRTAGRSFSKAGRYVYDGATVQITGTGLPDTVRTLIVSSADSVALIGPCFADSGVGVVAGTLAFDGQTLGANVVVAVSVGARLVNHSAGRLHVGGQLSNNGVMQLDGAGPGCAGPDAIVIRSTVPGTARFWSGVGTFSMVDVDVADQAAALLPPGRTVDVTGGTDAGGNSGFSFAPCNTGVADGPVAELSLAPIAPNPLRGSTRVRFALPRATRASLVLLDVSGRRVRTLADGTLEAGEHAPTLETRDLPPGLYWLRLATPDGTRTRAVVRVR